MSTEKYNRNYKMSDADLCMFTSNLVMFLTRDVSDLTIFGVTAPKIAALKALGDQLEVFPADGSVVGDVMQATEEKNAIREQVLQVIRNMAVRVEIKWGNPSPHYRKLNLKSPSQQSDGDLSATSWTVHTRMTEFLPDLADLGLTQEELDDFAELNESFEVSLNHQIDEIAKRDLLTDQRITLGNSVYDLVSSYCNIGKTYYEKISPARYDDYIIYEKSPGGLTAPTGLAFSYDYMHLSWNAVANATSYQLEADTGSGFVEIYAGIGTEFPYVPRDGKSLYRVRARNDGGFGPFSNVLEQYYFATLPAPTNFDVINVQGVNYHFSWSKVETAMTYNIFVSDVNIGEPAGEYVNFMNTGFLSLDTTLASGRYMYFKIRAANIYQAPGEFTAPFLVETNWD